MFEIKRLCSLLLVLLFIITGCDVEVEKHSSNNANARSINSNISTPQMELGDTPPTPIIEAAGKALAVYQSSYCWDNKTKGTSVCADYASPNEMLKDKVKEKVKANTPITFNFDVKKPTDVSLTIYDNGSISQVKVTGNSFQTPPEEGIYYYSLSAVWLTDIEKRISEGSSVYTFAIEVIK